MPMVMPLGISALPSSWQVLLVILFGLCVGSFLNVVVIRLPRGRSLISPSSRCGFCGSAISTWMNLPLVSFLISGGQCSKCGYAFSVRYFAIELLTAVLFASIWSIYGWSSSTLIFCVFSALFLAISFIDLEFRLIPDELSYSGWLLALFLSALAIPGYSLGFAEAFLASIAGALIFKGMAWVYHAWTGEHGLGGGDVKLMGFIGAAFGWQGILSATLVGSLLGAVVGIAAMAFAGKTRRFPIPFGPFLIIGALTALFGLDLSRWAQ